MIKSSVQKLAEIIGFEIGASDDETQSNLINGFSKGLTNSMQPDQMEQQICFIVDKLTPASHKIIKTMAEFVELKEKN